MMVFYKQADALKSKTVSKFSGVCKENKSFLNAENFRNNFTIQFSYIRSPIKIWKSLHFTEKISENLFQPAKSWSELLFWPVI